MFLNKKRVIEMGTKMIMSNFWLYDAIQKASFEAPFPIEFPTRIELESLQPLATKNKKAPNEAHIVCTANAYTLMNVAIRVKASKAHPSAQYIIAPQILIFK